MYLRAPAIIIIGLLLSAGLLRAEGEAAPGLTLAEAQRLALARNADYRVAQTQVDAALAQLHIARELPNPSLGLSVAKINTDQRGNRTAAGGGLLDRSYDSIVSLAQLLELGKRGPRRESARAGQRAAEAQRDDVRRLLLKSVSQAYAAALEANEEGLILANSAASLRHEADLADVRLKAGDIAETDKAQFEITASQRELDAAAARRAAVAATLALETLLGDPSPAGKVRLTDGLTGIMTAVDGIRDEARPGQRPDVLAAEAALAKAEADLVLQRHGPLPDLTVSVQFEHNPPDAPNTAGVGVSLPLPLWHRNGGAIRAALAARDQAQVQLERTRLQQAADLADARSAYGEAHRRAEIYRTDLTEKSAQVLRTVSYAYEHGGASLVELLAAERNDNEIRLAAARAQADAADASFALAAALNREALPDSRIPPSAGQTNSSPSSP